MKLYLRGGKVYLYVVEMGYGHRVRMSTGIEVADADWDPDRQRVRGNTKMARDVNMRLQEWITRAAEVVRDYELMRKPLTRELFLSEMESPGMRRDFVGYYAQACEQNYERRVISRATLIQERRTLGRLQERHPEGLPFSQVSRGWLEAFDAWMAEGYRRQGIGGERERERSLKHIRKYLRAARDAFGDDLRNKEPDPFKGFKWPRYQVRPVWLTQQEVDRLRALLDPARMQDALVLDGRARGMDDSHLEQHCDAPHVDGLTRTLRHFLFQCCTGLRYSDLVRITWAMVEGPHLVFAPQKTADTSGALVRMWVTPVMADLMGPRRTGRIFPDALSNQKYNQGLKELARLGGIEKNLTTHVGRHTFATLSLEKGIRVEVLQRLMGLTKISTLMGYVHVTQAVQDEQMRTAWGDHDREGGRGR